MVLASRLSWVCTEARRAWRRSWSRVTAQGMSENPGRDARMPPGLMDGFPDAGIIQLGRPWNVAVEQSCAVSVAGAQEGAAARRIPIPPSR